MKAREHLNIGENKNQPRIWLEGLGRLNHFGFKKGDTVNLRKSGNNLTISKSTLENDAHLTIVERRGKNILDINSQRWLGNLKQFREVKADFHINKIIIRPTVQAFYIHKNLKEKKTVEAVELFAGGGLFGTALKNAGIHSKFAIEIDPKYASLYQETHPETEVLRADIRKLTPSDIPESDIIVAGIPCTCHSNLGRTKKKLAGKPEIGEEGDLFLPVMNAISAKMPKAVVLENVANYANSLAGALIRTHLKKLGYHIHEQIIKPYSEWGDIQDRKRWCLIATLKKGFEIKIPNIENNTLLSEYLDSPSIQDKTDVERIQNTISGLKKHFIKQKEKGNGFSMVTLNGTEIKIPTITKSYHKINQGPFIETKFGLRMLRKHELEKIFNHTVPTQTYSTSVQILGQGISIKPFTEIFKQLNSFLTSPLIETNRTLEQIEFL